MRYPESSMNVAVVREDATVRIYGHESDGYRPFLQHRVCVNKAAAIQFAQDYNDGQRVGLRLRVQKAQRD